MTDPMSTERLIEMDAVQALSPSEQRELIRDMRVCLMCFITLSREHGWADRSPLTLKVAQDLINRSKP